MAVFVELEANEAVARGHPEGTVSTLFDAVDVVVGDAKRLVHGQKTTFLRTVKHQSGLLAARPDAPLAVASDAEDVECGKG